MKQLDIEAIETLKEVMEDDFTILLDTFFEDSKLRLEDLRSNISSEDAEALRRTAHSFKGSASNLGALALADLCMRAESLGAKRSLEGADTLVNQIKDEYFAVEALLKSYL
ncbi:Hpt domain-containing protein [Simiduia curdlanivorans]|uniref:Hpt domain-containing protein n=1 Tax=Simiduia curdlanivorans TaxID=1492769 RepID=A0ABV8V9B2_9GAMM|nr:Hpt domain-containing protein [Simiduia curdlanivorans]MDN3639862.1 Hpt domain-containing protein [Simiduia curdlanivorans]